MESRFNWIAIKLRPRFARSPSNTTANGIPVNEVYRLICEFRVTFVRNGIGNEILFVRLNIVGRATLLPSFVSNHFISVNCVVNRGK